jgi:hypothetical protein
LIPDLDESWMNESADNQIQKTANKLYGAMIDKNTDNTTFGNIVWFQVFKKLLQFQKRHCLLIIIISVTKKTISMKQKQIN